MSSEPEQNAPRASGAAGVDAGAAGPTAEAAGVKAAGSKGAEATAPGSAASKPRAGVPVWRTGKPDVVLAAAVDVARAAVETITTAEQIGRHLGARTEGDRLVTHLFESKLPGYGGWQWYAVLTRNSRSKVVTVDELGLLPSEDSILAPEWVPWAERVRPEDSQDEEAAEPARAAGGETAEEEDAGSEPDAGIEPDAGDGGVAVDYDDEDYGINDSVQQVPAAEEAD